MLTEGGTVRNPLAPDHLSEMTLSRCDMCKHGPRSKRIVRLNLAVLIDDIGDEAKVLGPDVSRSRAQNPIGPQARGI